MKKLTPKQERDWGVYDRHWKKVFDLVIRFQQHIHWDKVSYDGPWLEGEIYKLLSRENEYHYKKSKNKKHGKH